MWALAAALAAAFFMLAGVAQAAPRTRANFGFDPAAPNPGDLVTFTSTSQAADGTTIVDYRWDLDGNGSFETDTGSSPTATYTYPAAATVRVRLQVTDDAGGRDGVNHWVTIGGGTDHGEGTAQAALRELWEESGIKASVGELIGPVWHRTTEFSFAGMRFWQEEDYYVLRVGEVQVTLANLDPLERDTITGYRWWSREELAATTESFFPAELPELMRLADDAS